MFQKFISLLFLFISLLAYHSMQAQNNPYNIKDELFPMYERASNRAYHAIGLQIADSLKSAAREMGDKKAECLAYTIPVRYYMGARDTENLLKAVDDLKKVSSRNGYSQYYYYAYDNIIIHYLNEGNTVEAMHFANEAQEEANRTNDVYGQLSCLRTLANVYEARHDYERATLYTRKALDYLLDKAPAQDPTQLYVRLGNFALIKDGDYNKALEYAEKGIGTSRTERSYLQALLVKMRALYRLGRIDDFNRTFEVVRRRSSGKDIFINQTSSIIPNVYKKIIDKDQEGALAVIDSIRRNIPDRNDPTIMMLLCEIYTAFGDYRNAYKVDSTWRVSMDSVFNNALLMDLATLDSKYGDIELRNRNKELSRQSLDQELKNQRERSRFRLIILGICIIVMLIVLLFTIRSNRQRRRHNNDLINRNRQLKEARDAAERADRLKTAFVQNISHEIRTPLNAIVGFSQLIADTTSYISPENRQKYSQIILTNSNVLTSLVNDVMDIAQIENGEQTFNPLPVNINHICREAVTMIDEESSHPDVVVSFTTDVPNNFSINTDPVRLRQILNNLLNNAMKFTDEGNVNLHVSLSERFGDVAFIVTDTGIGVPPDKAEVIFERFKKLDSFKPGVGLGLHISRLIANLIGGRLYLDTNYEKGARFVLLLPTGDDM